MKKFIPLIVILMLIALGGVFLLMSQDSEESTDSAANSQQQVSVNDPAESEDGSSSVGDIAGEPKSADLLSVRDSDENGFAEVVTGDEGTMLTVSANLDPLPEGKFYEGWLVGGGRVISTGKLVEAEGGSFYQEYRSEENLSAQNNYVLTEETLADGLDGKPEAHVIEGMFN